MNKTLKQVADILFNLCKNGFYGSFTINFQNGKLINWNKVESGKFD